MISREDIQAITERLKQPEIEKVILFGSYAHGTPHKESDLDLIVVTKETKIPSSFQENLDIYIAINNYRLDYCKKFPIDLITYTKGAYERFLDKNSSFSQTIVNEGVVLYERKDD